MSMKLMSMVWDVEFPTQSQKLVMLKIADHANDEGGSIWPSKSRLARQTGASESTVQLALKVLRGVGLLHVEEPGGHGPRSTTKYSINVFLLEALSRGLCSISGCSDTLELEGDIPLPKGSETDPSKGSIEQGVDFRSHQPGPEKGVDLDAKGSAGRPQTTIKNLQEPSRACGRASPVDGSASHAQQKKQLTEFEITPTDPQWNSWLQWFKASNRHDLEAAAIHHQRLVAYGAKWPDITARTPRVDPIPVLSDRSKAMSGEAAK